MSTRKSEATAADPAGEQEALFGRPQAEVELLFDLGNAKQALEKSERAAAELKAANRDLRAKIDQLQADQEDIFIHLHQKLDQQQDRVQTLEEEKSELLCKVDSQALEFERKSKAQQAMFTEKSATLENQIEFQAAQLRELEQFRKTKSEFQERTSELEAELERTKQQHQQDIAEIELQKVQEKERLKREMLVKIKETKKNLLSMTQHQLDCTTKRTFMENEHMATELQYQSKETEKLLAALDCAEREAQTLKREVALLHAEKLGHAKKANLFWSLSQKLAQGNEQCQQQNASAHVIGPQESGQLAAKVPPVREAVARGQTSPRIHKLGRAAELVRSHSPDSAREDEKAGLPCDSPTAGDGDVRRSKGLASTCCSGACRRKLATLRNEIKVLRAHLARQVRVVEQATSAAHRIYNSCKGGGAAAQLDAVEALLRTLRSHVTQMQRLAEEQAASLGAGGAASPFCAQHCRHRGCSQPSCSSIEDASRDRAAARRTKQGQASDNSESFGPDAPQRIWFPPASFGGASETAKASAKPSHTELGREEISLTASGLRVPQHPVYSPVRPWGSKPGGP
mmetsp:Transcript_14283/g.45788  ORF Transcript_14283/g.45788 Transcript_14283/m.45788 type:complete len:572 (+) Transcript_14283:238-1953(+)